MKDWLATAAAGAPDSPALVMRDAVVPYRDLDRQADLVAGALNAAGIGAGHRIALWATSTVETVAAVWGIPRSGAMAVFLGTRLLVEEAKRMALAAGVQGVWGSGPDIGLPSLGDGDGNVPEGFGGPPVPSAAFVIFTSGSEGAARPVILTGANLDAAAAASQERLDNGSGDCWLCVLPLHHVGGLSILWRSAREAGTVMLEEGFDPARAAALMASGRVTLASLVPTMLSRVLAVNPGPYAGLSFVLVGGGPVAPSLLERARAARIPAVPTYGMTETASQVATGSVLAAESHPGTVGRLLRGFELRLVGEDGVVLAPGSPGRIEVRGPAVSPGYLDGPRRAAGDWFRTGDMGALDGDGCLTVLGRADEVIVTGGENVHPAEVESVLLSYPGVEDAVVRGEADPEWGQVVVAEVTVRGSQSIDLSELERFVRARLAGFKVPRRWGSATTIDRSEMGKRPGSGAARVGEVPDGRPQDRK
jgi:O-succinylbenzoic acid--CoA ligase